MPAFINNGPDIPERLLQEHEEGHVVFFCGAGISYPAGLPGYRELVDCIYNELGTTREPIENQAYQNKQYDATLFQLERRYPGRRVAIRKTLPSVLKPRWRKKNATTTHEALLKLGTDRNGNVKLVTTNFDGIFKRVIERSKRDIPIFAAPLLPIPKPTRWHGVVHLHGLLPDSPDEMELNRLVLTSGDFGLAYLTERWAACFVSDLFQNFTVIFVGYSIEDPVLRYMMDALAADELLGEIRSKIYAFASFHKGEHDETQIEWQAKGVEPLLYEVPVKKPDHSVLHCTLKEWADTYHDGVHGKKMIIAQHATVPPPTPSRSDFAVGRVLWALTDELAASHFANLNPVPPLEWLEPLTESQFCHDDLSRFGVVPCAERDSELHFSVICGPASYRHAPMMCVADSGTLGSRWDKVMAHLARWLTRHLDDPKLLLWLAKQGGQLHEQLAREIQNRIEYLDRLAKEDKRDDLNNISENAPKAIPGPLMRTLWELFLTRRVKSYTYSTELYGWLQRFKLRELTPALRLELRELLSPRVALRQPFRIPWNEEATDERKPERIEDIVDWEIELTSHHARYGLRDLKNNAVWQAALPDLLLDFTILLRDALDLKRQLGRAMEKSDRSYIDQPSIREHLQNRDSRDWTVLIDLIRDAWSATMKINTSKARLAVEDWWYIPYPLFKRLVFFAAANSEIFTTRQVMAWLLSDGHWWLWSVETMRETIRLLVALAPRLDTQELAELEQAILKGPPRELFKEEIEDESLKGIVDREMWLRLAKIDAAGVALGHPAKSRLDSLSEQYPNWQITPDERDEFPFWIGKGDEGQEPIATPRRRRELVEWLKQHPPDIWLEDDWQQRCHKDFPTTACALCGLARENEWPAGRWNDALHAWSKDDLLKRSWRHMTQLLNQAPDNVLHEIRHALSWWLHAQSKIFKNQKGLFLALIGRLMALDYENIDQTNDPITWAINHPIGLSTEALLRWWHRQDPKDSQGLGNDVKPLFTQLCDSSVDKFRSGRIVLTGHAIALFRVDQQWTEAHLLPLFDWQQSPIEASAAWQGFLFRSHFYRPLMTTLKQPFLETVNHYDQLGQVSERYAAFLTFAALNISDIFTKEELTEATSTLPPNGLQSSLREIARALNGAGEQCVEYWRNRVSPYFKSVWPKSLEALTPEISENLGRNCLAAKEAFPEALKQLLHMLQPVKYSSFLVHILNEAGLCKQYPSEALTFLDTIIDKGTRIPIVGLKKCLDDIADANNTLADDRRFVQLTELCERQGHF